MLPSLYFNKDNCKHVMLPFLYFNEDNFVYCYRSTTVHKDEQNKLNIAGNALLTT